MKMKLMLVVLLLIAVNVFAQTPEWQWATQAGGYDREYGKGITIDSAGNSYVTGFFEGSATFGSFSLTSFGERDVFVAKMDIDGNWLWAVQAGGTAYDYGMGIYIDSSGNNYVTGSFEDTATFGSYTISTSGGYYNSDVFVAKIDADGNWLWASQAGGVSLDSGNAISMDSMGNYYVTGEFINTADFGPYSITSSGSEDIFIAKMDTDGNWLWATSAGGDYGDHGKGITIDNAGNIYTTGWFTGEAVFGSHTITNWTGDDIFVAKMDTGGNWIWAVQAGENFGHDHGLGITIDNSGFCYVTGYFAEAATFGSFSVTGSGNDDIFVAKINPDGNWIWATQAGGTSFESGNAITFDDAGYCYVTGWFDGTATFGTSSLTSSGEDIFVAKIDGFGNWQWATQSVSTTGCASNAITMNDGGDIYVTGYFWGAITFGSYSLTSIGDYDVFVAQLGMPVSAENELISTELHLSNYPNPFNPTTTIYFNITTEFTENTELVIYNIKGRKIRQYSIFNPSNAGQVFQSSIIWDGTDTNNQPVGSGIYFYKLNLENSPIKKMTLLK